MTTTTTTQPAFIVMTQHHPRPAQPAATATTAKQAEKVAKRIRKAAHRRLSVWIEAA